MTYFRNMYFNIYYNSQISYSWPTNINFFKNNSILNKTLCGYNEEVGTLIKTHKKRELTRYILPPTNINKNSFCIFAFNLVKKKHISC